MELVELVVLKKPIQIEAIMMENLVVIMVKTEVMEEIPETLVLL